MNRCLTGAAVLLTLVLCQPRIARAADEVNDKDFLIKSFVTGTKEIKLSELAETHSDNPDVKKFAKEVIDDHKRMNETLAERAKNLKIGVVAGAEKETKDAVNTLSKLKSPDFDREYLKMMIEDHQAALDLHERYSKATAADKDLAQFCKEGAEKIRNHLKMAKDLAAKLK